MIQVISKYEMLDAAYTAAGTDHSQYVSWQRYDYAGGGSTAGDMINVTSLYTDFPIAIVM